MRWLALGCVLCLACSDEAVQREVAIVVSVRADPTVAMSLGRLEARLFVSSSAAAPRVRQFALGVADGATGFPFSFVLEEAAGTHARLELLGFEESDEPVIEHKQLIEFQQGSVELRLLADCLHHVCDGPEQTCVGGASCAPLASELNDAGRERPAVDQRRPSSMDAMIESRVDASEQRFDAGADAELPQERLPLCPANNECMLEEYLCLQSDDGEGYSCRGQYAAWPMPDRSPGAKVAPRYSLLSEEVVLDEITGLAWQRHRPATYAGCSGRIGAELGDSCSHDEAIRYCQQLVLGDQRWRLPSRIELESLLDLTQSTIAIDPTFFPGTDREPYWSITPELVPAFAGSTWRVSFQLRWSTAEPRASAAPVRCVRSQRAPNAPPSKRYTRASGLVLDAFTTLAWSDTISPSAFASADDAASYCATLGLRLPTYKELLTLADLTREVASDREFFPPYSSQSDWVLWTPARAVNGEPLSYAPALGTAIPLSVVANVDGIELHARCVR